MAFQATGHEGRLCAGYAIAAHLGRWSFATDDPTCGGPVRSTVHARVVRTDTCLMAMGRFTVLRLTMDVGVTWSWSVTSVTVEDDGLTIAVIGGPTILDTRP